MLIYVKQGGSDMTIFSAIASYVGFITANLALIIGIGINIFIYYDTFICIRDLYRHLKTKKVDNVKDNSELNINPY